MFYWTSNLFSIVSGCPLLLWSHNLILADTVLSWFAKCAFSARVCKPACSHATKNTEHWTSGHGGRGPYFFLLIKPLKNHTHTHTHTQNTYIYACFKTLHLTSLSLQDKLSFQNQSGSDFFLSYFLRAANIFKRYPLFSWYKNREIFFLREADEILTNPTSQRKAILQKGPQRKGGISFPLQRRWCAMLWEGSLLAGKLGAL